MAVYTEVSDEELAAFFANFDLGRVLSFKGIAEGVENSNWLVHLEAGHFILTLYEKRVKVEDLPFFLGLMQHLARNGVNCPQPVADRAGKILGQLAGRPAALVTFLDGLSIRRPSAAHCNEVGAGLAQLHLAGQGFALHRENALSIAGWDPLWREAADRADEVAPGLAALIEGELAYLHQHWPSDLRKGVIHADLFPDNVFFLNEHLSGLIDFYFACNDMLAFDLVTCLNAWCFEFGGAFNVTKGMAMLVGYQRVRALEPREIECLPVLARGSALRFMLTRLVDWLNVPPGALVKPKDPMEYARKLRFHQSVSSVRDYGWQM